MQKLYQWLSRRARYFREEGGKGAPNRTVRTEVVVERSRATLLLGDLTTAGAQTCPVCGQSLAPVQSKDLPPKRAMLAPKSITSANGEES